MDARARAQLGEQIARLEASERPQDQALAKTYRATLADEAGTAPDDDE